MTQASSFASDRWGAVENVGAATRLSANVNVYPSVRCSFLNCGLNERRQNSNGSGLAGRKSQRPVGEGIPVRILMEKIGP